MARKRTRPITPTGMSGEELSAIDTNTASQAGGGSTGGGKFHQVQMEAEEMELRVSNVPEPEEGNLGGPEEENLLSGTQPVMPRDISPDIDEAFRQAVHDLPADRQTEAMEKRKRAA